MPFTMENVVWNIGDSLPLFFFGGPPRACYDMQVGIIISRSTKGLQNDNQADIQLDCGYCLEDVLEARLSDLHEWIEESSMVIEINSEKVWDGQYSMAVYDIRNEPSTDEIDPIFSVRFGA